MTPRGTDGPTVLVSGASGNSGRLVVSELRRRGASVRCGRSRPTTDADSVHLDFEEPSTFQEAVEGCGAVFLLRPPPISKVRETLNPFVDEAREAGVGRIVFLSVAGAEGNRFVPHHAVEKHLEAGPQDWTILRPGFFAQNLASAYLRDIVEDGRIYVPAGRGRVAFVDLRDVAHVAADALLGPQDHRGRAYTLTGPSAHTFSEVAVWLTAAAGHPIRYQAASVFGYVRHLRHSGDGWGQSLIQTILHVGLRRGQAESVDPTLERLLGRRPNSIERYILDHASTWSRPGRTAGA